MMRTETVDKLADALMDAMNDKRIKSSEDIKRVIRVATLTEGQKAKLDESIKAKRAELETLTELKKALG